MQDYNAQISSLNPPTFQKIRSVANNQLSYLPRTERDVLWRGLNRGTALLDTHEHLCQYLFSYGNMHQAKLLDAIKELPTGFIQNPFEVVDWGCGQAMGTINLFDHLQQSDGSFENVKRITLIEPATVALQRGLAHTAAYIGNGTPLVGIDDFFENISPEAIASTSGLPVLHIFSNILDVAQIDLKQLSALIDDAATTESYLLCVGPLNPNNQRIDAFFRYFKEEAIEPVYAYENPSFSKKNWTYKARLYKLNYTAESVLIPIEYYPAVPFAASYELDFVRQARRAANAAYPDSLSHFEVSAPFDLGANVYEDVHSILAVAHNIIVRGLPTKSSTFIEERMEKAFAFTERILEYGEIKYIGTSKLDYDQLVELYSNNLNTDIQLSDAEKRHLQLLLTPIAVARFQKVLVEALITGHLSWDQERWAIMVEEMDVPFAALAVEDFKHLFYHLTQLSAGYDHLHLPEIELHICSNAYFKASPLQDGNKVYEDVPAFIFNKTFDLVVRQTLVKNGVTALNSFSKFKCRNNCYFNIAATSTTGSERAVYTSGLIKYKSLVEKDAQGNYMELIKNKGHLTYFLQLFFRKEAFRPGQLPILDRALKNQPVIGLLPTGGGKSLTYQISALLQPGVTMIIDPLKSLMQDQYDGLLSCGIDCAAYINSSLSKAEKNTNEARLKSSQLLFIFLSPERLSIASFREELKHMHDYNVYFSYGVIDEVHCVSEWGHDFRFSYLHLGRNLYNYVRAKEDEISLLGLTATASFDVLADVERELSGNGAFLMDTDTTVRYENTNRLELQYKVEKVPVAFEPDRYYDRNNAMPPHLPKALNITNPWPQYDSKSDFIKGFIDSVPDYVNELQTEAHLKKIRQRFIERQNTELGADLDIERKMQPIPKNLSDTYNEAGIIFCPHVNSTGISVNKNTQELKGRSFPDVRSFSGKDTDKNAMQSLADFRDNKSPLMVATKAFGMGIDKPNVRYTINLNYSSSLEGFVQEAGRAGRDRKLALAIIFVSDYNLVSIKRDTQIRAYPISIIRNKWFYEKDLLEILAHFNLKVPEEDLLYASPQEDIVKLHCTKDNRMFAFNECSENCSAFRSCTLKNVNQESKRWISEKELIKELQSQGLNIGKKNFQYLNPDYKTVMYFFNENFKGDNIEKAFMIGLLNNNELQVSASTESQNLNAVRGFLDSVLIAESNARVVIYVPYRESNYADLAKAIYRMCCIALIEDFTQDYARKQFRIVAVRKELGGYYEGLRIFLLRYFTKDRAQFEIDKAKDIEIRDENIQDIRKEIYRCLAYLTEFVYDKISEKRKRAIDDMRSFCMEGTNPKATWIESNEVLKDFIYYYFNSKYAKSDYVAENGEAFSLVDDTAGGKKSSTSILFKYLRVIDDDVVGIGTPLDNAKHLYGAVRLISRSLTDSNPGLALLETFCLAYLGTKNNKNLENQLETRYREGIFESYERTEDLKSFWGVFEKYNSIINRYAELSQLTDIQNELKFLIHSNNLKKITTQYLE